MSKPGLMFTFVTLVYFAELNLSNAGVTREQLKNRVEELFQTLDNLAGQMGGTTTNSASVNFSNGNYENDPALNDAAQKTFQVFKNHIRTLNKDKVLEALLQYDNFCRSNNLSKYPLQGDVAALITEFTIGKPLPAGDTSA